MHQIKVKVGGNEQEFDLPRTAKNSDVPGKSGSFDLAINIKLKLEHYILIISIRTNSFKRIWQEIKF